MSRAERMLMLLACYLLIRLSSWVAVLFMRGASGQHWPGATVALVTMLGFLWGLAVGVRSSGARDRRANLFGAAGVLLACNGVLTVTYSLMPIIGGVRVVELPLLLTALWPVTGAGLRGDDALRDIGMQFVLTAVFLVAAAIAAASAGRLDRARFISGLK